MAVTMMSGLFVAVLCAGHTINREMKNGTVLLLMSKPITRFTYVLSKMSGILISLTAFLLICCSATCATVEIAIDEFAIDYTVMTAYFAVL